MQDNSSKRKVLIVDDEPPLVKMFAMMLSGDFAVDTAQGGPEALEMAQRRGPYAVVVSDMRMPGMDGIELLSRFKDEAPFSVRMLITGLPDRQVAVDAVNKSHVFRILSKPCSADELHRSIKDGVKQYDLLQSEKNLLHQTVNGEVQALLEILQRVSPKSYVRAQAIRLGMRQTASYFDIMETWDLEVTALLARIGEVTLPRELVAKAQADKELTREEREHWQRVPETGSKLLQHIPRLKEIARSILYQGKNFDGTGFPGDYLAHTALPLGARLLHALTAYNLSVEIGLKPSSALNILRAAPEMYDPTVVNAIDGGIVAAGAAAADGHVRLATKLRDLRVGHRLAEAVHTLDQVLVMPAGIVITDKVLDRLLDFDNSIGLRQPIYIEDDRLE